MTEPAPTQITAAVCSRRRRGTKDLRILRTLRDTFGPCSATGPPDKSSRHPGGAAALHHDLHGPEWPDVLGRSALRPRSRSARNPGTSRPIYPAGAGCGRRLTWPPERVHRRKAETHISRVQARSGRAQYATRCRLPSSPSPPRRLKTLLRARRSPVAASGAPVRACSFIFLKYLAVACRCRADSSLIRPHGNGACLVVVECARTRPGPLFSAPSHD